MVAETNRPKEIITNVPGMPPPESNNRVPQARDVMPASKTSAAKVLARLQEQARLGLVDPAVAESAEESYRRIYGQDD